MFSEKTSGGLIIQPSLSIWTEATKRTWVIEQAEEGKSWPNGSKIDPQDDVEFKDHLFEEPYDLGFRFIEPSEIRSEVNSHGQRAVNDSNESFILTMSNEDMISDMHENYHNVDFGLHRIQVGAGTSSEYSQSTFVKPENVNNLFTALARHAADNLVNGRVKKEDLLNFCLRDNGAYIGNDITSIHEIYNNHTHEEQHRMPFSEIKKISSSIIDELAKMHKDPSIHFNSILPKVEKTDLMETSNKWTNEEIKEVKGTALISAIINGIGARHFLGTYLHEFSKIPIGSDMLGGQRVVDNFLNFKWDHIDKKGMYKRVLQSLPIGSQFHNQAVHNLYRNGCA